MTDQGMVIDIALYVWFGLTAVAVVYVAHDAFRRNPEMTVMKWGWVLVTLYTGPIGAAVYVLACQEPSPGAHQKFITPLWKQGLGSTIHCLAGDATGIIIAAAVTMALRLNMATDLVVEYGFGFAFGLLIFQALFMRDMAGGSYPKAVRRSMLPEWISMNSVMGGMIPVMGILMTRHMSAMEPRSLRFWGVMSLSTIVGAVLAYPFNVWLVAARLKHGMGTVRVLGAGGHPAAGENTVPAVAMSAMTHTAGSPAAMDSMSMAAAGSPSSDAQDERGSPPMAMKPAATGPQIAAITMLSVVTLAAGVLLATLYGELTMRGEMPNHAPPTTMPMPMPSQR